MKAPEAKPVLAHSIPRSKPRPPSPSSRARTEPSPSRERQAEPPPPSSTREKRPAPSRRPREPPPSSRAHKEHESRRLLAETAQNDFSRHVHRSAPVEPAAVPGSQPVVGTQLFARYRMRSADAAANGSSGEACHVACDMAYTQLRIIFHDVDEVLLQTLFRLFDPGGSGTVNA